MSSSLCVPVGPRPLRGQLHALCRVVAVVIHDLGQAKVSDPDLTTGCAVDQ